jgi:hypothetical protein
MIKTIKHWWNRIPIGTRSILFGAHAFWLHWIFVSIAWTKLYGFPFDPRLWCCFFLHDLGYWSKPNMDGPEGETHPELGAKIMTFLFGKEWGDFTLFHSRYYAKRKGAAPSKLCFADKLSFVYTPKWIYIPMVTWTGEIDEYLQNAQKSDSEHWTPTNFDKNKWHAQLKVYFIKWVEEHKQGAEDTWTQKRHVSCAK